MLRRWCRRLVAPPPKAMAQRLNVDSRKFLGSEVALKGDPRRLLSHQWGWWWASAAGRGTSHSFRTRWGWAISNFYAVDGVQEQRSHCIPAYKANLEEGWWGRDCAWEGRKPLSWVCQSDGATELQLERKEGEGVNSGWLCFPLFFLLWSPWAVRSW